MIRRELRRFLQMAVAFFLYSLGIYLGIHANVGLLHGMLLPPALLLPSGQATAS